MSSCQERTYEVLLVEDNASDAQLLQVAWALGNVAQTHLTVLQDSRSLLSYLRRQGTYRDVRPPDLILLDCRMPDCGSAALSTVRATPAFTHIPVVVFTDSRSSGHVFSMYQRHANCCLHKPADRGKFLALLEEVASHWLLSAMLPPHAEPSSAAVHSLYM